MIKKALVFMAAATAVVLCTGCQATPEKPVVVQKNSELLIEKGTSSSAAPEASQGLVSYAELCANQGVPERFQRTITEGNLTISCDAAIELPETNKLPMARVEAGRFSQEQVYALFGALCADTPMYLLPEVQDKAFYEQKILECQARLAKETNEETVKFFETLLKKSEEQYDKAPDALDMTPADGTLESREFEINDNGVLTGTNTMFCAASDPRAYDQSTSFHVENDSDYTQAETSSLGDEDINTQVMVPRSGSWLEYNRGGYDTSCLKYCENGTKLADVTALSLTDGKAEHCLLSITPKQARDIVEGFMKEAGIDDMVIDSVSLYSSKSSMPPEIIELTKEEGQYEEEPPETHAYACRLLRSLNGVKTESTQDTSVTSIEGMSFGAEWDYEELTIMADDQGIAGVYWMGPLEVKEVITEDTAILPFGDIEDIFEKMIVMNTRLYTDPSQKEQIDITRVTLSLQRIVEQNSNPTGLLVPVWNFYGSHTSWSSDGEKHTSDRLFMPYLSVNAIDGSVIDVEQGF